MNYHRRLVALIANANDELDKPHDSDADDTQRLTLLTALPESSPTRFSEISHSWSGAIKYQTSASLLPARNLLHQDLNQDLAEALVSVKASLELQIGFGAGPPGADAAQS